MGRGGQHQGAIDRLGLPHRVGKVPLAVALARDGGQLGPSAASAAATALRPGILQAVSNVTLPAESFSSSSFRRVLPSSVNWATK